jgi:hypothetical protein
MSSMGAISASVGILNSFGTSDHLNMPASALISAVCSGVAPLGSCTKIRINTPETRDRMPIVNIA